MKAALLVLCLLAGCAAQKPDPRCAAGCVTMTREALQAVIIEAIQMGYTRGFHDGEDLKDLERLKAL